MNKEPDRKQRKKNLKETFCAEADQREYIMSLVCKVSCDSLFTPYKK